MIIGTNTQEDVSGEETSKQHDFGGKEEPNTKFGIVESCVRPCCYGERDVHGDKFLSWSGAVNEINDEPEQERVQVRQRVCHLQRPIAA